MSIVVVAPLSAEPAQVRLGSTSCHLCLSLRETGGRRLVDVTYDIDPGAGVDFARAESHTTSGRLDPANTFPHRRFRLLDVIVNPETRVDVKVEFVAAGAPMNGWDVTATIEAETPKETDRTRCVVTRR